VRIIARGWVIFLPISVVSTMFRTLLIGQPVIGYAYNLSTLTFEDMVFLVQWLMWVFVLHVYDV